MMDRDVPLRLSTFGVGGGEWSKVISVPEEGTSSFVFMFSKCPLSMSKLAEGADPNIKEAKVSAL